MEQSLACEIRERTSPTCQTFPLFSSFVSYTQVCGRLRGYQKGTTDTFWCPQGQSIHDPYVDVVNITRGQL